MKPAHPQNGHVFDPSPIEIWIQSMPPEHIELVCNIIIQTGEANNSDEALAYLKENIICQPNKTLAVCDIFSTSFPTSFSLKLKKLAGLYQPAGSASWRYHGIKGHQAIPALFCGELDERLLNPQISNKLPKILETLLSALNDKNIAYFHDKIGLLEEFYGLIKQVFKECADLMVKINREKDFFLLLQTMMSWARALDWYLQRRESGRDMAILFREILALPRQQGLSAGIIDAIKITRINGKKPNFRQNEILCQIARKKPPSLVHLHWVVTRAFPNLRTLSRLKFVIQDWKFPVGDGIPTPSDKSPLLTISQIRHAPLGKHKLQIMRYLALSSLGLHLSLGRNPQTWAEQAQFTQGELIYIMPERIITHRVKATPDDLRQFLLTQIVPKIGFAKSKAMLRETNNAVLAHLVCLLGNNGRNSKKSQQKFAQQLPLFQTNGAPTALEAIEDLRTFIDERRIIEQVDDKYHLHYGRLLSAIELGHIRPGKNWSPEKGGFVRCIFPDHADSKNPSMQISPQKGLFYCYGGRCERGGNIKLHSIPANLEIAINANPNAIRRQRKLQSGLVRQTPTPEHHQIMAFAQTLLQSTFWGSAGEQYLANSRSIDPYLAYNLGAGFGTDYLIEELLNSGYTYDNLIFYGFVALSPKTTSSRGIVPLLLRRGMKIDEIKRQCGQTKSKEPIYGLPYSTLRQRVTFPLGLYGKIDNFYGRSLFPDAKLPHLKLTKEYTGIPHGLFNSKALLDNPDQEIKAVEAAIDAISLVQIGQAFEIDCEMVVGIIGTLNYTHLAALVSANIGGLGIAFDLDPSRLSDTGKEIGQSGQVKTQKILAQLKSHGTPYPTRDFTADFYAGHPELEPAKDWNSLLRKMNYHG